MEGVKRAHPGDLSNWYAAVPSYHFGWVSLAAAGIWWCWRNPVIRGVALVYAALMWWAIVVTGNHYFFDMVLGATIVGACFFVSYRWERWTERHPETMRRWFVNLQGLRLPF
jgi:membrane-associated phospholipid phosphatase